jgi:hypothetical protein
MMKMTVDKDFLPQRIEGLMGQVSEKVDDGTYQMCENSFISNLRELVAAFTVRWVNANYHVDSNHTVRERVAVRDHIEMELAKWLLHNKKLTIDSSSLRQAERPPFQGE